MHHATLCGNNEEYSKLAGCCTAQRRLSNLPMKLSYLVMTRQLLGVGMEKRLAEELEEFVAAAN